jgi:hypothetical protein
VSADRWAALHVVFATVADFGEVLVAAKDTAAEPDCVSLYNILSHIDLNRLWRRPCYFLILIEAIVNSLLH